MYCGPAMRHHSKPCYERPIYAPRYIPSTPHTKSTDPYRGECLHTNYYPVADDFGAFGCFTCEDCGLDFIPLEPRLPTRWQRFKEWMAGAWEGLRLAGEVR